MFIVIAHWNNNLRVDISLHSNTLCWLRANHSLLLLLNASFFAEKQKIQILYFFAWPDYVSNPQKLLDANHYTTDVVKYVDVSSKGVMVFNPTFNNSSVILWQSVLLVEEIGVPGENHWPTASHGMLHQVHPIWTGFKITLAGRFGRRSRLVKVDFAFSLVKREIQVAL